MNSLRDLVPAYLDGRVNYVDISDFLARYVRRGESIERATVGTAAAPNYRLPRKVTK